MGRGLQTLYPLAMKKAGGASRAIGVVMLCWLIDRHYVDSPFQDEQSEPGRTTAAD